MCCHPSFARLPQGSKRFEKYLEKIPLPDEKDPSTRQAWKRFRASSEGAPVKVFRPAYLD